LEKLHEIAFHFEAKNDFFNKMDFLKIENKHYKNKKSDFFVKKMVKKIQNKWALNNIFGIC